jgi:hypothetical protein
VTAFITIFLNMILYEDVISKEAQNREKLMKNLCRQYVLKQHSPYLDKLKSVRLKMKTMLILLRQCKCFEKVEEEKREISVNSLNKSSVSVVSLDDTPVSLLGSASKILNENSMEINNLQSSSNIVGFYDPINHYNFTRHSFSFGELKESYSRSSFSIQYLGNEDKNKNFLRNNKVKFQWDLGERQLLNQDKSRLESKYVSVYKLKYNEKDDIKSSSNFNHLLKAILILSIFVVMWVYMLMFIKNIHEKYGENFVKICVIPLISMIFVQWLIVQNIVLFITTFLMYFFGKKLYHIKRFNIFKFLFDCLVPITASNHHQAILLFRIIVEKMKIDKK